MILINKLIFNYLIDNYTGNDNDYYGYEYEYYKKYIPDNILKNTCEDYQIDFIFDIIDNLVTVVDNIDDKVLIVKYNSKYYGIEYYKDKNEFVFKEDFIFNYPEYIKVTTYVKNDNS